MAGRKSLPRRLLRLLLWLLFVSLLVSGALLLWLSTDSGRNYVRGALEDGANEALPGSLKIGAIEGSLFGEPTLKNISLSSPKNEEVLRIDRLDLVLSLQDLLAGSLNIDKLAIDGLHLKLKQNQEGQLNLLESLIDPEAEPSDEPMVLRMRGITIDKSELDYTDSKGKRTHLSELSLKELQVDSSEGKTTIVIDSLAATMELCGDQRVRLSGEIQITEAGFSSSLLTLNVGTSQLRLSNLTVGLDGGEVHAELSANLQPELLNCLTPETRWLQPIEVVAEAEKKIDDKEIRFSASALNKALVISNGKLAADLSRGSAIVALKKLQPGHYVELEPELLISGTWALHADSLKPENIEASIEGTGRVKADGVDFNLSKLSIVNKGKQARIALGIRGVGGFADGSATLLWGQDPRVLADGNLNVYIPRLSDLPVALPMAGSLKIVADGIKGPVDALAVKGKIRGHQLRFEANRASSVSVDFNLQRASTAPLGKVDLKAQGLRQGKMALGSLKATLETDDTGEAATLSLSGGRPEQLWVDLKATLSQDEGRSKALLHTLRLRHRRLQAVLRRSTQRQATVTLHQDGSVSARDLRLALAGGSIAVEGSSDSKFTAKLRGLKLTSLLPLLPPLPVNLSAAIDGKLTARPGQQGVTVEAILESKNLTLSEGGEALHVELTGRMAPGSLEGGIELQSAVSGGMKFQFKARQPRVRWSRASAAIVRSSSLSFDAFDLELLRPLHKELASLSGELEGKLSVGAGARRIEGNLVASRLRHESWQSERLLRFEIDATQKNAALTIAAKDSEIGEARLKLGLRPPGPLHSPWRWPRRLKGLLHDSELELEHIDLVALQNAVPGLEAALGIDSGTLDGKLSFREKSKTLAIGLQVSKLSAQGRPPIDATIDSTLEPRSSTLNWQLAVDSQNKLEGELTLEAGLALLELRSKPDKIIARLKKTKIQARASGATSSPALWARFAGSENDLPLSGRVTLAGKFAGTFEKPGGETVVHMTGVDIDGIFLRQVSLEASLKRGDALAKLSIFQSRGRRAAIQVEYDMAKARVRKGTIDAQDIDLRLLRALDKTGEGILSSIGGVANGKFEVSGSLDALRPSGSMQIADGAIDPGGSLLPIVDMALNIEAEDRLLKLSGKAKSGSGRIKLSGQAKIDGSGVNDISVRLRTTKVPVVVASLVCSVDLDSHSQIALKPGLVDIKTNIDSALVRVPIRSFLADSRSLHSIDGMSDLVYISEEREAVDNTIDQSGSLVRLRIRANKNVIVRTNELLARVVLDVDTTFVDNKVVINGNASVASGHIDLFERRYAIEKASANFRGRVPTNPSFDLRLRHDFDQLALTILGRGAVDDPKISFLADPADYDQATLLAIVLGQAPAQNENQLGLRDNALSALSTYAANKVQEILAPILPFDLDVVRVENTDNDGYLYVGGKWITDDWFVAYHHRTLAEDLENTNEAESKYRLSKGWSLEGVAGESEAGLDILWTKRWGK